MTKRRKSADPDVRAVAVESADPDERAVAVESSDAFGAVETSSAIYEYFGASEYLKTKNPILCI